MRLLLRLLVLIKKSVTGRDFHDRMGLCDGIVYSLLDERASLFVYPEFQSQIEFGSSLPEVEARGERRATRAARHSRAGYARRRCQRQTRQMGRR